MPTECGSPGVFMYNTQYPRLFLHIGENSPQLEKIKEDVDLEIQAAVTEDAVARLQLQIEDLQRGITPLSVCTAVTSSEWEGFRETAEPGKFIVTSGEAVTEAECQQDRVTVRETETCFNKLPIVHSRYKFLDLRSKLLINHASPIPCTGPSSLYFRSVTGQWFRHQGKIMSVPEPLKDPRRNIKTLTHPLDRHLSIYTEEEIEQFRQLQIMPASRQQITNRLTLGICAKEENCPAQSYAMSQGSVYDLKNLEEKIVDKATHSIPGIQQLEEFWDDLDPVGKIGGIISFVVVLGGLVRWMLSLCAHKLRRCVDCDPYVGNPVRRGPGFYQQQEMEMRAVEMQPLQREVAENPINAVKGGMSE